MQKKIKQFWVYAIFWAIGCWLLYVWLSTSVKEAEKESGTVWNNLSYIVTNFLQKTTATNIVDGVKKTE